MLLTNVYTGSLGLLANKTRVPRTNSVPVVLSIVPASKCAAYKCLAVKRWPHLYAASISEVRGILSLLTSHLRKIPSRTLRSFAPDLSIYCL